MHQKANPETCAENIRKAIIRACLQEDTNTLKTYNVQEDIDLNAMVVYQFGFSMRSPQGSEDSQSYVQPLLHYAIAKDTLHTFTTLLDLGLDIEIPDPTFGKSPLNYAASLGSADYAKILIAKGADVNSIDFKLYTPLVNAYLNNPYTSLINTLLSHPKTNVNVPKEDSSFFYYLHSANVYSYYQDKRDVWIEKQIQNHHTFDATYTLIINNQEFVKKDIESLRLKFDQDIVDFHQTARIAAHKLDASGYFYFDRFEDSPHNLFPVEGLTLDRSLPALMVSLHTFYKNVVIKSTLPEWSASAFREVYDALYFTYVVNQKNSAHHEANSVHHYETIEEGYYHRILSNEITIIPSGGLRHSVYYVIDTNKLYRVNRGEGSDLIHGIDEFVFKDRQTLNIEKIQHMLDPFKPSEFFTIELPQVLTLEMHHQVKNPTQTAENCAWTSGETAIEAAMIAAFLHQGLDSIQAHTVAKASFHLWEEYDMSHTLIDVIDQHDVYTKNNFYDTLFLHILQAHHDINNPGDIARCAVILNEFDKPKVKTSLLEKIEPVLLDDNVYGDFLKACNNYRAKISEKSLSMSEILHMPTANDVEAIMNDLDKDTCAVRSPFQIKEYHSPQCITPPIEVNSLFHYDTATQI